MNFYLLWNWYWMFFHSWIKYANFSRVKPLTYPWFYQWLMLQKMAFLFFRLVKDNLKEFLDECEKENGERITYCDTVIKEKSSHAKKKCKEVREEFCCNLIEKLNQRFPESELDILQSFDNLFNSKNIPVLWLTLVCMAKRTWKIYKRNMKLL